MEETRIERCKKCYQETVFTSQDYIDTKIILSKDKYICDYCGKFKRYVVTTRRMTKQWSLWAWLINVYNPWIYK